MAFFTSLTSSVATQYFFVVRTKSCTPSPPLGPDPCALRSPSLDARAAAAAPLPLSRANKSAICTTNTALWSPRIHGCACRRSR